MPSPYFSNYSGTKVFDDYFSKGLYFELKGKGVDVLSVKPGCVSTKLNGSTPDLLTTITPETCAKGILNKATSFETFGGNLHEVHGLLTKNVFMDLLPDSLMLKLSANIGKGLLDQFENNLKRAQ